MAGIIANVDSDVQKLRKLKNEIEEIKKALKGINIKVDVDIAKGMESQLKSLTDQYHALVAKVAEAEGKIMLSTKRINDASAKIIEAQEKISKVINMPSQQGGESSSQGVNAAETASIQAQAKAYEDLKTEINDILGTRDENVKRMVDEMNAIRLINAEIKKITKSQGESSSLSSAQQKRLEQLNNSLLTHKTALSEVRQTLSNNVKLDNVAATSMNGLSQSLSRMRIAYRELTEEERKSPIGKELLVSINQADAKIKELDATIGNHQRNVGHYAGGWNGLNMSVQQIVRELPAATMGLNMFFLAISNNLPILTDEIKRAKERNAELIAQNQKATPVWKQLVSSIFSWQTAMMVGITLLTVYGKEIGEWTSSLFKAKKVLSETYQVTEEFQKSVSQSSGKVLTTIEKLSKAWMKFGDDVKSKEKFILDYKSELDSTGIAINNVADAENLLSKNKDAFINAIIGKAKATAIMELASKEYEKYIQKMLEADAKAEEGVSFGDRFKSWMARSAAGEDLSGTLQKADLSPEAYAKEKEAKLRKDAENYRTSMLDLIKKALGIDEKSNEEIEKAGGTSKDILVVNSIETIEAAISTKREEQKKVTNRKDYLKIEAEIKAEQAKLYAITGNTKQENQAEKLRKEQEKYNLLLDKQALDRQRQQEDLETKLTQSKIDAMASGFDKEQAQRELNNKKEIQSLQRQKEDYIRAYTQAQKDLFDAQEDLKAKQTKGYVKKSFDSASVSVDTSSFDAIIDNTSKRQQNDKLREQEDSWDEYLIKYGTFQGKKAALTRKYEKLIAGESDASKAALLQKEFEDALSALDVDKLKQDINWELVFGDLSKVSKKELDKVNIQLKNFRKSSEYQNMTVEQKKVIDEVLDNMQSAIIDKGGILGDLPDQLDNLRKAQDELQRAQDEYNKSLENGTLAEQENAKKKQNFAEQNLSNAAVNVEKSKNKAINNITAITNAISQLGNAEVSLSDFGSVVGTLVDVLSQSGTKIGGLIASVLSMLDVVGEKGTLNFAEDLVSNIFESLRKALAKDTQQIVKLHTFGLLDIDLMGPDGTAYYEGIKEQLEAINKVYEKIIANSKEGIQFGEGFAAIESASTALDNYNKKVENLQKIADASGRAGASWNHHSAEWHSNKNVGVENFSQMGGIIDKSIQSMDDLYYLSGDELYLLMTQMPEAWSAIDGRIRENLENIINCKDEANELKDALNQAMTGIDQDSFYNGFIDQLSDMDTSFEDMCDNFEGYLRKSIISGLIASQYKARIDGLYEQWSEAAKSDKEITEDESGILQQTYKEIIEDMMKDREQMAKGFGWDSSSSSQSSTSKGFQAMSQDTGEELNGRFTALQIAGEEIKNQNNIQSQSLNLLTAKADAILSVNTETRNIADDTRDLIAQSYLELVQISENTGNSAKYLKDIKADIAEVKNNTKGLSSK